MLLEYIEFEGPNYEPPIAEEELQEDEIDGYMMFGIAIALLLAYMIIT
jgi:hypothetical protein